MKSPVILNGELTLEGLLAACVHEETGEIRDAALAKVPIGMLDTPSGPVWLASSVMFNGFEKLQKETITRSRSQHEMGPDFYEPNLRARIDRWAVKQDSGDFKCLLETYTTTTVPSLVWYAYGDMDEAARLLSTQRWLGKRRGSGFGEIAQISVSKTTLNPLIDQNGMVRRPVPIEQLRHIPGAAPQSEQVVFSAAAKHPAWAHEPQLCAMPPSKTETQVFVEESF